MLRTIEIRDVEELESYRLAWTSLWRAGRQPMFTQSLDWLAAFVRLQSDRVALRAMLVSDDDETLGIVPLVLFTESSRSGPLRTLRYPLFAGTGCCGPIGSQPTFVMLEAMQYLMRHQAEWDVLDLEGIDVEAVDHGRTKTALQVAGVRAEVTAWQTRPTIALGEPEEAELLASHATRALRRDARFEYIRYRPEGAMHGDVEPCLELFDDCLQIAATEAGNAESLLAGHALLRKLHNVAARNGTLDLNLLYIDDAPAAFTYGYVDAGAVTLVDAGTTTGFAIEHPGEALAAAIICDSVKRGDLLLDLGIKPRPWLRTWSNRTRTLYRAQSMRPSGITAQAMRWGRALRRRFGDAAAF